MHGSMGGSWNRGVATVTGPGHPAETPGLCAGAYRRSPLPRHLPTRPRPLRHLGEVIRAKSQPRRYACYNATLLTVALLPSYSH